MADILLQKPLAGQSATLTPLAEDRLVFAFDSAEATLSRDGDNLIMSFEDGSSVTLSDFYVAYTSENMPTFIIEGAEVDGESFFAALGEELMPAAGTASAAPQGSGSSVDTLAGTLLDGIDRLGGLDQAYPDNSDEEENHEGGGIIAGDDDQSSENAPQGALNLLPKAEEDTIYVPEGGKVTGNILDNDSAGDTANAHTGKEITTITPPAGWETLPKDVLDDKDADFGFYNPETGDIIIFDTDGNYEFVSSPDSTSTDTDIEFSYTIEDANGDASDSKLTISVGDLPTSSLEVDESALNSKDGSTDSISKEAWLGNSALEHNQGEYPFYDDHGNIIGTATVNPDGSLSVTLTENTSHDQGGAEHNDSVTGYVDVVVNDADGNAYDVRVNVDVKDDGPTATNNSLQTGENDSDAYHGNLLADDDKGADGWAEDGGLIDVTAPEGWTSLETSGDEVAKFESEAGIITFDKDGNYTFTPDPDYSIAVEKDFTFTYTVKDGDGDTASANLDLTIKPEVGEVIMPEELPNTTVLNLAVIVDSSGSMNASAMDQVEAALQSLGDKLDSLSDDAVINVCLIDYNKAAQVELKLTYDPATGKVTDTLSGEVYESFEAILDTITWTGKGNEGTNMDAALNAATGWFNELGDGSAPEGENFTIFMTDGQPTYAFADYVMTEDMVSHEQLQKDNGGVDPEMNYVSNGESYPASFTVGGVEYAYTSFTLHDYDNSNLRNDAYVVYTDADTGKVIVIVDDRGTSGTGFSYYEFDSEEDIDITFNNGKITVTGGLALDEESEKEILYSTHVDVKGQSLNAEEDIANGQDGNTWQAEDGNIYRLVQSEAANGQTIEAPMLQVKDANGIWQDVGQVEVITDGSGDVASENEKEHTQEAADALNEAMGYTGENESGIFAIGFGTNANTDFLKTITLDGQVYSTDNLADAFDNIMSVVAAEIGNELEQAVNAAMENVEGVTTSQEQNLLETLLQLGDEGKYDVLNDVANAIDDVITKVTEEGLTLESGEKIDLGFNDQIIEGDNEDDVLIGFSGNDTISGGHGHDIIFGGAGDDSISGGAGNDILFGGEGNDTLDGGSGNDLIFAGLGDKAYGGSGNDTIDIRGVNGEELSLNDLFIDGGNEEDGSTGMDVLIAGAGADVEELLKNGNIVNMEVIVQSDDANAAQNALDAVQDGSFKNWESSEQVTDSAGNTYTKYEQDDVTVLIHHTVLDI